MELVYQDKISFIEHRRQKSMSLYYSKMGSRETAKNLNKEDHPSLRRINLPTG